MAETRRLTRGERWLCNHVFGDTVPKAKVEVIRRHGISGGFTPYGRINLDPSMYIGDFIGHEDGHDLRHPIAPADKCHHFLHEMAHSWQHYVGMIIVDSYRRGRKQAKAELHSQGHFRKDYSIKGWGFLKFQATYSYDITQSADLLEFRMEQQCEIIADYFGLALWGYASNKSALLGHQQPSQAQLQAVLTNFLADPGYPRDVSRINKLRANHRARWTKWG